MMTNDDNDSDIDQITVIQIRVCLLQLAANMSGAGDGGGIGANDFNWVASRGHKYSEERQ